MPISKAAEPVPVLQWSKRFLPTSTDVINVIDRPEEMHQLAAQIPVASAQTSSLDIDSVRTANPCVAANDVSFFLQ